jgi:hypothetical protein
VLCTFIARAQVNPLAPLNATLAPLREHANDRLSNDHGDTRGATPQLTVAKHQMRDWIESKLAKFPASGDTAALAAELHAGLRDAHLFCDSCFPSFLGFVDDVQLSRDREFLIVRTSMGIWCGYDDSAYAYEFTGGRWQRIWEKEQNVYTAEGYMPQILYAVHVSAAGPDGRRLLLTLGSRPGCSVAFQPVYYNVWQIGRAGEKPNALMAGSEFAYIGEFPPIHGRVESDDVLIEFTAGGSGYGLGHEAARHYKLRGGQLEPADPIAPTPRDFVEEWLSSNWEQSATRSESTALRTWHAKLHRDDGMGDFPDPTLRCETSPDLFQVGIRLHDVPGETWYLVHWSKPDRFTMADIRDRPDPDCTVALRDGDFPRTFFPGENR